MFWILFISSIPVFVLAFVVIRAVYDARHESDPYNQFIITIAPFTTTEDEAAKIPEWGTLLLSAGFTEEFVQDVVDLAMRDQGTYDLFAMWVAEKDQSIKEMIITDIEDSIEDYSELGEW